MVGPSWEGLVIETLLAATPSETEAHFYRTAAGAEIDLVLHWPSNCGWAIEIKRSLAPKLDRGFHHACADLQPERRFVVYAGAERFPVNENTEAISLTDLGGILLAAAAS